MSMLSLILTQDVENVGRAGEIVQVKPGYGRNYLLPRGLALVATRDNVAQQEHHRRAIAREQERIKGEHRKVADLLAGTAVSIARKVGKDDKLFGWSPAATSSRRSRLKTSGSTASSSAWPSRSAPPEPSRCRSASAPTSRSR